jgi:tetratricopeptide (TPR) repeat protein
MSLYYLIYLWFALSSKVEVTKIARANKLIGEAEESYKNGHYVLALVKYRYLLNNLKLRNNHMLLNLAHCYYLNNDKQQAQKQYEQLTVSTDAATGAIAYQQLGVIFFEKKQYTKALDYFKKSLAIEPANEASRFNYELTARLLPTEEVKEEPEKKKPDTKKEEAPPPPQDENMALQSETESQEGQDQKNTDAQQQEINRKLRKINLSEEKAKMILDAMKNSEIQYIQQSKKQSAEKSNKNLPDW